MTLLDFIEKVTDDYSQISIFYLNGGNEILNNVAVCEIEEELEKLGLDDLLQKEFISWDTDEQGRFTINID